MRIYEAVALLVVVVALAGCRTTYGMAEQFGKFSQEYNRQWRWQEQEQACINFAAEDIREECLQRARAAEGVSVADYRVKSTDLDLEKGTATVRVEIDYYILPSTQVKTVEDVQKWRYDDEEGRERWRLISLPPEFK